MLQEDSIVYLPQITKRKKKNREKKSYYSSLSMNGDSGNGKWKITLRNAMKKESRGFHDKD